MTPYILDLKNFMIPLVYLWPPPRSLGGPFCFMDPLPWARPQGTEPVLVAAWIVYSVWHTWIEIRVVQSANPFDNHTPSVEDSQKSSTEGVQILNGVYPNNNFSTALSGM